MLSPFSPALRPRTVALRAYRSPHNIRSFRPCRCYSTSTQPPDRSTTATQDNPTLAEEKVQDVHSSDVKQEARAEGLHSQVLPPEKDATPTIQMEPFDASSSERGNNHLEELKESLRGWTETAATTIRKHADHYTARTATTFAQLGRELNKVTGYGEIELLKRRVVEQETKISAARHAARQAKEEYSAAVIQRANSQRDVNDLLGRKSNWNDEDVSRFTALVRQDHLFEQQEASAKVVAEKTEGEVEREFTELMRVILSRYHEEQVWSDKIRSASTYGSLTVLGLNLVVFIMAILFVEPWKRKRLAQTFERKVEEMTAHTQAAYNESTQNVVAHLKKQDEIITQLVETLYASMHPEFLSTLAVEPESKPPTVTAGESGEENVPTEESVAPAPPMSVWDTDLPLAIASSATLAAIMGWVARSWYGR